MRTNLERGGTDSFINRSVIFVLFFVFSEITEDDLRTALPHENTYDVGEIEGSKLKDLFEYNSIYEVNGKVQLRLLQVSGKQNFFSIYCLFY